MRHLSFELGVHGFTGPMNGSVILPGNDVPAGRGGSFGFHYGLNWGVPAPLVAKHGVGLQLGVRATDSNLSGSTGDFGLSRRDQLFVTAGAYRRVEWGLQGGFVFDYRHEEFHVETDLWQLRGELSWLHPCAHEFGFLFAANVKGLHEHFDDDNLVTGWRTTDYYAFFYRRRMGSCGGAQGRFIVGGTGKADGLIGIDMHIPLSDRWALRTGFTYLIPNEGGAIGVLNESWNVPVTFTWYPNGRARMAKRTCFEPLFDVADNGSFLVDWR
jgi:hypothetical protein